MSLLQGVLLLLSFCIVNQVSSQYASHAGYSRQRYPNPVKEPQLCGRANRSYVCDPDHILESQDKEASQLDRLIGEIINASTCPCSAYSCEHQRQGYKIGIALIQKMQFDDDKKHEDYDIDEGEARKRKIIRNLHQAQLYAHEIQNRWMLGHCDEDVIIFYSHGDNVVYTATGDVARMKLTNEIVALVARDARHLGFYKSPFEGLWKIVNDYQSVFMNSYRPRKPTAAELRSQNFGVSLANGHASVILTTCVIVVRGFIWAQ